MEFLVCSVLIMLFVLIYNSAQRRTMREERKDYADKIAKLDECFRVATRELEEVRTQSYRRFCEITELEKSLAREREQNVSSAREISALEMRLAQEENQSYAYAQEIEKLKRRLGEIRKELDFYKNIEENSKELNITEDEEEYQRLIAQAVQEIESAESETILDSEQLLACREMENGQANFFVTGKAGTGKSFLLNIFKKRTKKNHIILAPTGIAALNVDGATLHSTFGYYNLVNLDIDEISLGNIRLKSEKKMALKNVSTIIIDEISMVRADTFDKIDRILKAINQNDLPFGGKQLLLFGDLFQLPPVAKQMEYQYLTDRYGGVHFFCSDAYKNGNFRFLELTINHRQKSDMEYFNVLNRVREGSVTKEDLEALNSCVVQDVSAFDLVTTLLPTKAEVEALNQQQIDKINDVGYTYHAEVVFSKKTSNNQNLEAIFPISQTLYLKKGAFVMMVANDPEHRWVNGTRGIVKELSKDGIKVSIDGRTFDVLPVEFTEEEITYNDGKIMYEDVFSVKQYPIVPAYAITIHKSQGQTYPSVLCDIDRCFASGQAYVALSRCTGLKGLHLKRKINSTSIRVDKDVLGFYRAQKSQ